MNASRIKVHTHINILSFTHTEHFLKDQRDE